MKIKWESNSRAKQLAALGKIKSSDIIPRTQTDNFPTEAATVRMSSMGMKVPFITVHIRGERRKIKGWNGRAYEVAQTCRVNFGGDSHQAMNSNGDLDESLTWMDVHNIVTEIKEAMRD